jgi:hypothetical protein
MQRALAAASAHPIFRVSTLRQYTDAPPDLSYRGDQSSIRTVEEFSTTPSTI